MYEVSTVFKNLIDICHQTPRRTGLCHYSGVNYVKIYKSKIQPISSSVIKLYV